MRFLVPLDFSDYSKASFYTALQLMNREKDELILLHVTKHDTPAKELKETKLLLHTYGQICDEFKVRNVILDSRKVVHRTDLIAESNHVGKGICNIVDQYKVDMLVISKRGMGALEKLLVGSNTNYCLKNANCTLVVLKNAEISEEVHFPTRRVIDMEEKERERRLDEMKILNAQLSKQKKSVEEEMLQKIQTLKMVESV